MAVARSYAAFGILGIFLACTGGTGESGPDATPAGACPEAGIEEGAACAIAPTLRCMVHQDDCALAEVCSCTAGEFVCAPVDYAASCGEIEDAHCAIEGVHGCYMHPTSGERHCETDQWVSTYSCPPGCPGPDDGTPQDGDACSVADGQVCVYDGLECECVDSEFRCCDSAPCAG